MMEEGQWGRRLRLFYHLFYGEGFVVRPGKSFQRERTDRPFAGDSTLHSGASDLKYNGMGDWKYFMLRIIILL